MRFTVKAPNSHRQHFVYLPAEEKDMQMYCELLGIPNDMKSKIVVVEAESDYRLNALLKDREYNLEELNFLTKSMDRYIDWEADTFYAVASAMKYTSMKDLINLSFNIESYNVLSDFRELNKLGKHWYMNEHGISKLQKRCKNEDVKRHIYIKQCAIRIPPCRHSTTDL